MFERIAQTEAEKDAEAAEGRSRDQITAIRIAAAIVLINAILAAAAATVFKLERFPIVQICLIAAPGL